MTFRIQRVSDDFAISGRLDGRVAGGHRRGPRHGRCGRDSGGAGGCRAVVGLDILGRRACRHRCADHGPRAGEPWRCVGDVRVPARHRRDGRCGRPRVRRLGPGVQRGGRDGRIRSSRSPWTWRRSPELFPAGAGRGERRVLGDRDGGELHRGLQLVPQRAAGRCSSRAAVARSSTSPPSRGLIGLPGNPAYSASKYAVQGLTKSIALSYAGQGIRCNSVGMAATATPMIDRAMEFVQQKRAITGDTGRFSGAPGIQEPVTAGREPSRPRPQLGVGAGGRDPVPAQRRGLGHDGGDPAHRRRLDRLLASRSRSRAHAASRGEAETVRCQRGREVPRKCPGTRRRHGRTCRSKPEHARVRAWG